MRNLILILWSILGFVVGYLFTKYGSWEYGFFIGSGIIPFMVLMAVRAIKRGYSFRKEALLVFAFANVGTFASWLINY